MDAAVVYHAPLHDPLARAVAGYEAVFGLDAPAPTRFGCYEVRHETRRYIVVGNVFRVFMVYRILPSGALQLLGNWPAEFNARHHDRVRCHVLRTV